MKWKDPAWRYTRVADQGPDYLKRKFDKIRKEQRCSNQTTQEPKQDGNNKINANKSAGK